MPRDPVLPRVASVAAMAATIGAAAYLYRKRRTRELATQEAAVPTVHVGDVPPTDEWTSFLVNSAMCDAWTGEPLVVWHRRDEFYACQEACPHASISLTGADIEDFRPCSGQCGGSAAAAERLEFDGQAIDASDLAGLSAPCVACPAHMYVFELQHGVCLTNASTRPARTYEVFTRPSARTAGLLSVHVATAPRARPEGEAEHLQKAVAAGSARDGHRVKSVSPVSAAAGNAIQLALVSKGLERRYGPMSSAAGSDPPSYRYLVPSSS